ncbi:hypothetical protein SO802_030359 [Lithocarpus litseifolius]|uniref:Uncharacterized protein n=1 Tax=Lithocarpus litseifolius TaxID=425828 RepID=A0AAW2BJ20_9ROSI
MGNFVNQKLEFPSLFPPLLCNQTEVYGRYFSFMQGCVYLILIYLQGFIPKKMVNPWKTYIKLSAVLVGSHGLTKGSLAFLNYPALIMFKSTKFLPVIIMGAFIPGLRRKYLIHECISTLLLVIGLILFTLADAHTSPNFSIFGVVMILATGLLLIAMGIILKMLPKNKLLGSNATAKHRKQFVKADNSLPTNGGVVEEERRPLV